MASADEKEEEVSPFHTTNLELGKMLPRAFQFIQH
jgi:hypothetical protein